ncbi:protein PLANT CADMIUM RESISTANCE 9-like [Morone saxatilis]|uniref:protein PLANT CADMIUM RESISTANCE 9-like n=1 Tax=Morone saxatilis TaxID=34816 RepID=UPI0015E1E903|nr:protein PLANT CADMIUM RESISTANCE 9-like [Morone saxatilis]
MRNRYGIKGSICKDIGVSCFCVWCAWCQMHRELKHRKKIPTVVNAQPPTFVNAQSPTFVNAQSPTFVNAQPPTFVNAQPPTFVNAQQNAPQRMAPQPVFMSQPFMVSY